MPDENVSARVLALRSELVLAVADEHRIEYSLSAQAYGPVPA